MALIDHRPAALPETRYIPERAIPALLIVLSLIPLSPLLISGSWPISHEKLRYIVLLDGFRDAFLHGIPYPRWLPDLFGGYGYPTFCFYQPGFFYIALPFSFLPGYPLLTMYLALLLLFSLGTVGVYKLCAELSDRTVGLVCAALFAFTPYLYVNLYVRGDLSELAAMLLCPWPLYFLFRLKNCVKERQRSSLPLCGLALALSAVIVTHPAVALIFLPVLCLLAITIGLSASTRRPFALRFALSVAGALALTCPYWWTVFQMRGYVNMDPVALGYYRADLHTVHFSQLFSRNWEFGLSVSASPDDTMSFQLGLFHFILATAGAFLARKIGVIRASYILYVLLILAMTPLSNRLWAEVDLLRLVQFPWRILSVTATLQVLCIAGLKRISGVALLRAKWRFALPFLLMAVALWHSNQFSVGQTLDIGEELRVWRTDTRLTTMENLAVMDEFTPWTARDDIRPLEPRGSTVPIVELHGAGRLEALEGSSSHRLRYRTIQSGPATVRINQIYFPGWQVIVDGQRIPRAQLERDLTEDGRMTVTLPAPGRHTVDAFYGGPPGWEIRNSVAILALLGFVWFWLLEGRMDHAGGRRFALLLNRRGVAGLGATLTGFAAIAACLAHLATHREALEPEMAGPEVYYKMGLNHRDGGRLCAAVGAYRKALSLAPEHPDILNSLALAHLMLEDLVEAQRILQRLVDRHPGRSDFRTNLIVALLNLGDTENALSHCRRLLKHTSDKSRAYVLMGRVYQKAGDLIGARQAYRRALRENPHNRTAGDYLKELGK